MTALKSWDLLKYSYQWLSSCACYKISLLAGSLSACEYLFRFPHAPWPSSDSFACQGTGSEKVAFSKHLFVLVPVGSVRAGKRGVHKCVLGL